MIIFNKSADYSGLGIGKAPVVTDETKQLLSGFTGMTDAKALAFQRFVETIGGTEGSIWGKLDFLYIPMFANGVLKDSFYNVKSGAIRFPNSDVTEGNVANYYSLTASGVRVAPENWNYVYYIFKEGGSSIIKGYGNILLFAVSEYTNVGGKEVWYNPGEGKTGTSGTGTSLLLQYGGNNYFQVATGANKEQIYVLNQNNTDGYAFLKTDALYEKDMAITVAEGNNAIWFGSGKIFIDYIWEAGLKVYGFGSALTPAEARLFAHAIDTFNSAV